MKYDTIVADPPWQYNSVRTGGSMKSGSAQKYPTMSLEEICALPLREISNKNAVLFLWGTTPLSVTHIPKVIEAWGFTHKTTLYWYKVGRKGLGYHYAGNVEPCFMCFRGTVKAQRTGISNVIEEKPTRHSRKPEKFWDIIAPYCSGNKLEMFCRGKPREGWDGFGYECETSIDLSKD